MNAMVENKKNVMSGGRSSRRAGRGRRGRAGGADRAPVLRGIGARAGAGRGPGRCVATGDR